MTSSRLTSIPCCHAPANDSRIIPRIPPLRVSTCCSGAAFSFLRKKSRMRIAYSDVFLLLFLDDAHGGETAVGPAYDCTNYAAVTFLFGGPVWRWLLEAGTLRGYSE